MRHQKMFQQAKQGFQTFMKTGYFQLPKSFTSGTYSLETPAQFTIPQTLKDVDSYFLPSDTSITLYSENVPFPRVLMIKGPCFYCVPR
jgi:hypothetical protein